MGRARDVTVPNVVGSNLFNLLSVPGASSIVAPAGVRVSTAKFLSFPTATGFGYRVSGFGLGFAWRGRVAQMTRSRADLSGPRTGLQWFDPTRRGIGSARLAEAAASPGGEKISATRPRNPNRGKGDPKWRQGRLRRDLVESLGALRPAFIHFPGGCVVEGAIPGNHYQWKNTVGPLIDRIPDFNLWGALIQDSGYCQSNQIGL